MYSKEEEEEKEDEKEDEKEERACLLPHSASGEMRRADSALIFLEFCF